MLTLPVDQARAGVGYRPSADPAADVLRSRPVLLRTYHPDDLGAIHVVNEAAYPAVGTETIEDLAHIAEQSLIALVAEQAGTIAGFCMVLAQGADYDSINYLWFSERYPDFVYLDRVAISPEFQRRGLGRRMYAEVERLAIERRPSATHFTLEVNLHPRNDESLAFHAGLGFVEVGQQETDYGALVSLMAKPLAR
jgi:predicted GNAT superfamily acetyltransferase